MSRLLITTSIAVLLLVPIDAAGQSRRRDASRPVSRGPSAYDREVRYRQTERRVTEYRRLRDRQRANRYDRQDRYEVMDSIGKDDCCD